MNIADGITIFGLLVFLSWCFFGGNDNPADHFEDEKRKKK